MKVVVLGLLKGEKMTKKSIIFFTFIVIVILGSTFYFRYDKHPMEDVYIDDIVSISIERRGNEIVVDDEKDILNIVTVLNSIEMRNSFFGKKKENKSGEPVAEITLHYKDEDGEHDDEIIVIDKRFIFNNKVYITKRSYFLDVYNMIKQLEVE